MSSLPYALNASIDMSNKARSVLDIFVNFYFYLNKISNPNLLIILIMRNYDFLNLFHSPTKSKLIFSINLFPNYL